MADKRLSKPCPDCLCQRYETLKHLGTEKSNVAQKLFQVPCTSNKTIQTPVCALKILLLQTLAGLVRKKNITSGKIAKKIKWLYTFTSRS